MTSEERLAGWIYGQQSRIFFGDVPWDSRSRELQEGWLQFLDAHFVPWGLAISDIRNGWNDESDKATLALRAGELLREPEE